LIDSAQRRTIYIKTKWNYYGEEKKGITLVMGQKDARKVLSRLAHSSGSSEKEADLKFSRVLPYNYPYILSNFVPKS